MAKNLQVFYDALCPLCSKEIKMYEKRDVHRRLELIDISSPNFVASDYGLDPQLVVELFHVKTAEGQVITGVSAFVKIWEELEIFEPLQVFAESKIGRPIFNSAYVIFAKYIRPRITRAQCNDHVCSPGV